MRRTLSNSASWSEMSRQVSLMADTISLLYPGLLALAAIAGLRLAWAWYHRIADRPVGAPPVPFPGFGFNDQLIWGWVLGLALALLSEPSWAPVAGANVLLVWGALYATRGLAVVTFFGRRTPPVVLVALGLITVVMLPFVLGGLTIVGLADTWLDFRRRLTPATGGYDR
jgi:uncharacterized protein YybS (DUF2232 family)